MLGILVILEKRGSKDQRENRVCKRYVRNSRDRLNNETTQKPGTGFYSNDYRLLYEHGKNNSI